MSAVSGLPAYRGEVRAMPVFDKLPDGCSVRLVCDDRCEPLFHAGEFVVVDPSQCKPINHALFVIEHGGRQEASIVQVWNRADRDELGKPCLDWWTGPYNRPRSREAVEGLANQHRRIVCIDGPYASTGKHAGYLASKLRGRVIGIYESAVADRMVSARKAA